MIMIMTSPRGAIGEVVVRGPQVMTNYYKDDEITAKAMTNGWFHTGDLGLIDDEGHLYIKDRKKDMIKTGGENVFSAEVERIILENPKVKEVAVIGLPDEKWGERVVAVVLLHEEGSLSEPELSDFCRTRLTHFKSPRQFLFVTEPLPKTSVGKLLKRELRDRYFQIEATN